MPTVLVVEDEPEIRDLVERYLTHEGFDVSTAADGPSALDLIRLHGPDVIVLDVMLPGLDGIEVCRRLRQFSEAYVIMLTAKAEEVDKLIGLAVGADDYLTKPFSPRELVARVKALVRRAGRSAAEPERTLVKQIGDLVIDEGRFEVTRRGEPIALTVREFQLLLALTSHPGRVFTRSQLLERVWGNEYYDDHVVDVHVANLRKKIEDDPSRPSPIETVRGVGYRLRATSDRS